MDEIVRGILHHADLLDDDLLFLINFLIGERRPEKHVRQDLQSG